MPEPAPTAPGLPARCSVDDFFALVDRGLLHPELTESATRAQAAELATGSFDAHASCNRTCELGMTRATGAQYQHVLELVDWASAE